MGTLPSKQYLQAAPDDECDIDGDKQRCHGAPLHAAERAADATTGIGSGTVEQLAVQGVHVECAVVVGERLRKVGVAAAPAGRPAGEALRLSSAKGAHCHRHHGDERHEGDEHAQRQRRARVGEQRDVADGGSWQQQFIYAANASAMASIASPAIA